MLNIISQRNKVSGASLKKKFNTPFNKLKSLKIGESSVYQTVVDLTQASLDRRGQNEILLFCMVLGNHAEDQEKADAVWNVCWKAWNGEENAKEVGEFLRKVLGSLLMLTVIEDSRQWICYPDPEKKEKIDCGEIPDAVIYYLGANS